MLLRIPLLLLVSVNCSFVHALECMARKGDGQATGSLLQFCELNLGFHQPIPSDAELKNTYNCDLVDVSGIPHTFSGVQSCFASIFIDYNKKLITVRLTYHDVHYPLSPLYDMMSLLNKAKSVVRYEIDGLLESQQVDMLTSIQCTTGNDCALAQLRTMFPTLLETQARLEIFKEMNDLLNGPPADSSPYQT